VVHFGLEGLDKPSCG